MKIGIIGTGGIGQALASPIAKAGYEIIVSNSRGPESLAALVTKLGPLAKAGTRQEAAQADFVVLAVPWEHVRGGLSDLPSWNGRLRLDSTNPMIHPDIRLAEL